VRRNIHKISIDGEYKRVKAASDSVLRTRSEEPRVPKNALSVFSRALHFMPTEATFLCIL